MQHGWETILESFRTFSAFELHIYKKHQALSVLNITENIGNVVAFVLVIISIRIRSIVFWCIGTGIVEEVNKKICMKTWLRSGERRRTAFLRDWSMTRGWRGRSSTPCRTPHRWWSIPRVANPWGGKVRYWIFRIGRPWRRWPWRRWPPCSSTHRWTNSCWDTPRRALLWSRALWSRILRRWGSPSPWRRTAHRWTLPGVGGSRHCRWPPWNSAIPWREVFVMLQNILRWWRPTRCSNLGRRRGWTFGWTSLLLLHFASHLANVRAILSVVVAVRRKIAGMAAAAEGIPVVVAESLNAAYVFFCPRSEV